MTPLSITPTRPLAGGAQGFSFFDQLVGSLPTVVRRFVSQNLRWQQQPNALWPVSFLKPDVIVLTEPLVNETRTVTAFYDAIAQALASRLETQVDFEGKFFTPYFVMQGCRRFEGQLTPFQAKLPTPTAIFLEKLEAAEQGSLDEIWRQAVTTAHRRDPFEFERYGGQMILNRRPVKALVHRAQQAVRFLNRLDWEVGLTLRSDADLHSQEERTTLRFEGIWKRLGFGPLQTPLGQLRIDPGAEFEGRVAGLKNSDLLWLGGLHLTLERGETQVRLEAHGGYSGRNVLAFADPLPGGEVLLGINTRDHDHFFQIAAGISYGLNADGSERAWVGGLFLKSE